MQIRHEDRIWSHDRVKQHLRRLLRPRLSNLLIYLLFGFTVAFIFIFHSSSNDIHKGEEVGRKGESQLDENAKEYDEVGREKPKRHVQRVRKPSEAYVNPHNYHLMISNANICSDIKKLNLLLLVASAADHHARRQAIRETWGDFTFLGSYGVRLIFLLANPNDSGIQRKIVEEYRSYGDTVQEDFVESYFNLTLKSVMGIKWALNYCPQATFVMKTDDDIFVNIPLLLENLIELQDRRIFTGCIKQRKSFQPVNGVVPLPPAHPPFAAGAGYVFSGSLLQELYEASLNTRIIPVEDVYITGHLARIVGAHPPIHDDRFSCGEMVKNDCDITDVFTGHRITPERMKSIWEKVNPNRYDSPCSNKRS